MRNRRAFTAFITGSMLLIVGVILSTMVISAQDEARDLPSCGAFETMRLLQPPESVIATPVTTPDSNAPTPTTPPPTGTPRPAPAEDRVGFPENYATDFKLLFVFDRPDRKLVRAICGNEIAAQHRPGEPFAYGSVLLMISYSAKLDEDGQPVLDENGHYIREKLVALHVQRKEKGFGEAYGEDRAGEWEYVAFNGDGSYQNTPETTNFCAVCHGGQGGASIDYVFRMNLMEAGEASLVPPPNDENEIGIYLYSFHDPLFEVKAGTTVTWVNYDQAAYKIVEAVMDENGKIIPAKDPLFESPVIASASIEPGASFSFTFEEPGEYLYISSMHNNITGKIVVTE